MQQTHQIGFPSEFQNNITHQRQSSPMKNLLHSIRKDENQH